MYSYEELEKIYYRRKIQKIAIFVSISLMFIVGAYLVIKSEKSPKNRSDKVAAVALPKKEVKIVEKRENLDKPSSKKEELVLSFILPDIQSMEEPAKKVKKETPKKVKKKEISKPTASNSVQKQEEKEVKKERPLIVIKTQKLTLKDLLESYQNFPTFDKAIRIANIYFKKNSLKESKQWALKANNIDPTNYKSWIIFAKILIKQNKRKEAIKVLKTYIENYGNNEQIENFIRSLK